jgi:hypothetical protein
MRYGSPDRGHRTALVPAHHNRGKRMKTRRVLKSALLSATAVLLVAACANAAPKNKQRFELFVPVATQVIKSGQYCGRLSGALSSGEFFDGLQRLGNGRHIQFRKDAQPVKEFPSNISVALAGKITPCPSDLPGSGINFVQPGNGSSPQAVNEFMNGLKFTAEWKNPGGVQPASNWSVTKSLSNDRAWHVNDQIPMRFAFQVPSQGVPLTNQLMISVYAPSGAKLATFTAGVLSRLPKRHAKTIRDEQSDSRY